MTVYASEVSSTIYVCISLECIVMHKTVKIGVLRNIIAIAQMGMCLWFLVGLDDNQ
jgi:hypothetical protein